MYVKTFCWCCGTDQNDIYKNPRTGYTERFCMNCKEIYTAKERKDKEFKLIFGIMSPIISEADE